MALDSKNRKGWSVSLNTCSADTKKPPQNTSVFALTAKGELRVGSKSTVAHASTQRQPIYKICARICVPCPAPALLHMLSGRACPQVHKMSAVVLNAAHNGGSSSGKIRR